MNCRSLPQGVSHEAGIKATLARLGSIGSAVGVRTSGCRRLGQRRLAILLPPTTLLLSVPLWLLWAARLRRAGRPNGLRHACAAARVLRTGAASGICSATTTTTCRATSGSIDRARTGILSPV